MGSTVKVSNKNQIVVPAHARKELGIEPGDQLLVVVRDGAVWLFPRPESFADALVGLGHEVWEDIDTDEYIRHEREAWEASNVRS